jgi:uncharacterized protein
MKILAAGDLHGDTRQLETLAEQAEKENVDLIILTGDLTRGDSTDNLIGPFAKRNKKVLLIPGNHETVATADFLAELYNATNLHGYSIKIGDIGFFGCGGSIEMGHPLSLAEEEISKLLSKGHEKISKMKKKIMVTHVHPAGSLMEKFSNIVAPSKSVTEAINKFQPDIVLCGHVHEAEGIEEKIGNSTVINPGRKGKIIEI